MRSAPRRCPGYTERSVHTVAGAHFDWSAVLAAGGSLSLFADKQIVEIRIPSGKPGKDGSAALQQVAERRAGNDSTLTLVLLPRLDFQTKKSAWFAALEGAGVAIEVQPVERCAAAMDRSAWRSTASAWPRARRASAPCSSSPTAWKATCSPPTRRSEAGAAVSGRRAALRAGGRRAERGALRRLQAVRGGAGGPGARVQRMLDGLQAEGEAEVLVHYTLAEDIRALKRVKDAMAAGRPLPMALREQRVWGLKEKLFERVLPRLSPTVLENLLHAAHVVDGIVKGLKARLAHRRLAGAAQAGHGPVPGVRRQGRARPGIITGA